MNSFRYPALLEPNGEGGYIVSFRDVPEALTEGWSLEEAKNNALDALITSIEFYIEGNKPFPLPSSQQKDEILINLPISVVAKVLLLNAMTKQHIRPIDLANKMKVRPQEINRIIDLKHNTKIDTIEKAFNALNLNLNISVTN